MKDTLTKEGHDVRTAKDGLSALDILKDFIPDVIFIDLVMPNIGGEKLCEIIRRTEKLKNTYVVILSAIAAEEEAKIEKTGADACIAKRPFVEMTQDIHSALDQARLPPSQRPFSDYTEITTMAARGISKELLSVKRHFEITLARMSEGILEITPEGRIVYANPAALSLFDIPEETLLGSRFIEAFSEHDQSRIRAVLDATEEDTKAITHESPVNLHGHLVTLDMISIPGNGNATIVIVNDVTERKVSERALRNAHDELEERVRERTQELVKVNEDLKVEIEERKHAEAALGESEEKYRSILESIEEGYFEVDLVGNFTFFNRSLCDVLGYPSEELLGMNTRDCGTSESAVKIFQVFDEIYRTGKPVGLVDYEVIRKDGSSRILEMSVSLIKDAAGEPAGFRGVTRDTTENRKLRAQLLHAQKMESIGTIASGVAHNFRNILSGISINNQLLEMKYENDQGLKEIAGRVNKEVDRGVQLTGRMLQFSHKEKTENFKVINLNEVIQQTYDLISKFFDKKVNIQMDLPESVLVMGNHSGLSQVIMNLCTNSRDAMPRGGQLHIAAKEERGVAKVIVSDTGRGMDKETVEKCFDPFFTTKNIEEGTGLGLSTSYGIVKEHGGDIHAYSEIGQGTVFKIYLPALPQGEEKGHEGIPEVIPGRGEKILLVDDEIESLQPMEDLLEAIGYRAASVSSGKEGIAKYASWQPDVVLMDRNMPEMDGITCAERILEKDPGAKIILVSGYDEEGPNGIDARTKNMIKGYITKPADSFALSRILNRVIR
jgi:PAS domain S-box-containing protein